MEEITMGSLFSGSGGFELAGSLAGIMPVWTSEIEPFPILVTATRFPDAERFRDIKKMDGGRIPKVDIITGGSPCQDMSIAGQRAGLDGAKSNLFREQIRIVKEMRESDEASGRTGKDIRPRYMVWENVPGAFSSNKGEDFRTVLEEIARIKDSAVSIPMPEKGKWKAAGCIVGDDYSIAWRVLDAQYFGVPQRRKRIYLVADFGGGTAPEILFKQDGMRGNTKESIEEGKDSAGSSEESTAGTNREDVICYDIGDRRSVVNQSKTSPTLTRKMGTGGNNVPIVLDNHPNDSRVEICEDGVFPTLTGRMGTGGGNVPMVIDNPTAFHMTQDPISGAVAPCLTSGNSNAGQAVVGVVIPIADKATRYKGGGDTRNDDGSANSLGIGDENAPSYTLTSADKHSVTYAIDRAAFNQGMNAQYDISVQEDIAQTLVAKGPGAVAHETYAMQGFGDYKSSDTASALKQRDFKDSTDLVVAFEPGTVSRVGGHFYEDGKTGTLRAEPGDNMQTIIYNSPEYIVRRLTPTECGRLQGFPDGWADNLAIAEPTEDDIMYWRMVFKEQAEALEEKKKEKTDNQIRKWLQNPESDSAKYKMWGNGIALPCAVYVMQNIAKYYEMGE